MGWISVDDRSPVCYHELCETGEIVSDVVLVSDHTAYAFSMGFGHINDEGEWTTYEGEHDFMNVEKVTHWMPLPEPPKGA